MTSFKTAMLCSAMMVFAFPAAAQIDEADEVVVTGVRVTQGGAQDINHFRGEIDMGRIPEAESFSSEGLLSGHDLFLKPDKKCAQALCLVAKVMPVNVDAGADYFMGLGFDTDINPKDWQRAPLNLVAVIDKSGSMSGAPLEHAKQSLIAAIGNLQPGDQLSVILYGDSVYAHLPPTQVTRRSKSKLKKSVSAIESNGSTNMEAGLRLGFETARETAAEFDGATRLMLFTDERPNVGATDAGSFMDMATKASLDKIGMTTIGVGEQFDGDLAGKISSVRGGNLFFIRNRDDIDSLFKKDFDYMITEVAHDLRVNITPKPGLEITGVYGVPQDMFSQTDDGLEMRVASTFLSRAGGGMFFTLSGNADDAAPAGLDIASISLSYNEAESGKTVSSNLSANLGSGGGETLQKAQLLTAQYTALKASTLAFHQEDNPDKAYKILNAYARILDASPVKGLEEERSLVASLNSQFGYMSGNTTEKPALPGHLRLLDKWRILTVAGSQDLRRGDVLQFDDYDEFTIFRKRRSLTSSDEYEDYRINKNQVYLEESDLTLNYSFTDDGDLWLRHPDDDLRIKLRQWRPDDA